MALKDVQQYIEAHKNEYPLEALVSQLRNAGYPEEEIQDALLNNSASHTSVPVGSVRQPMDGWHKAGYWILGLILGGAAIAISLRVSMFLSSFFYLFYFSSYIIFLLHVLAVLAVPIFLFFRLRKKNSYLARGVLIAPIAVIAVIVTLIFILFNAFGGRGFMF